MIARLFEFHRIQTELGSDSGGLLGRGTEMIVALCSYRDLVFLSRADGTVCRNVSKVCVCVIHGS